MIATMSIYQALNEIGFFTASFVSDQFLLYDD